MKVEQMSLFGNDTDTLFGGNNVRNRILESQENLPPSQQIIEKYIHSKKEYILDCIRDGVSVRNIANRLMNEQAAPGKTYISGTPRVYPYLMLFLESLDEVKLVSIKRNKDFEDAGLVTRPAYIHDAKYIII